VEKLLAELHELNIIVNDCFGTDVRFTMYGDRIELQDDRGCWVKGHSLLTVLQLRVDQLKKAAQTKLDVLEEKRGKLRSSLEKK